MISQDRAVKVTDFGLAGVLGASQAMSGIKLNIQQGTVGLSGQTIEGTGFGTPPYMPPEQFTDAASCGEGSDIYSFGVVLFQMASKGRLPFLVPLPTDIVESETARFWREMHRLHSKAPVPKLDSPLFPIIQRCMEKEPGKRYQNFKELRGDLDPLLRHQTSEIVRLPEMSALAAWEWNNKGFSLNSLGRHEEAIHCYDKALELDARDAKAWYNRGIALDCLCRYDEAVRCYDKALVLDSGFAVAWYNKGLSLGSLGQREEEMHCFDKALELDPRDADAWYEKGDRLGRLGRNEEALRCYDKVLELDPLLTRVWHNKGNSLHKLGRFEQAIRCYDRELELDSRSAKAWCSKGYSFYSLGRCEEAIRCYDRALGLDPGDLVAAQLKGLAEERMGIGRRPTMSISARRVPKREAEGHADLKAPAARHAEGPVEHRRSSGLGEDSDPEPHDAKGWLSKGYNLANLGRHDEAIQCYDKALGLDPRHAAAWYNKGVAQENLDRKQDAVRSYKQFIALGPTEYSEQLEYAQRRIRELERM